MDRHCITCSWRLVECPLLCFEVHKKCDMDRHVKSECGYRRVDCPLRCKSSIIAKTMASHLKNYCPNRPVECSFCSAVMSYSALSVHQVKTRLCQP